MARRRKRRRINKGRVAALLIIILVIAAGIFFVTTRFGRTSYASVNKSMGEYMVKAILPFSRNIMPHILV